MRDFVNYDVEVEIEPQYDVEIDGNNSIDVDVDDGNNFNFDCRDGTIYIRRETYEYKQTVASNIWLIEHELKRYPSVTVVDSAGTQLVGDVQYISNKLIMITFAAAFSGTAYLN